VHQRLKQFVQTASKEDLNVMSKELRSALRGSGVGTIIGFAFGLATLSTIGFDRMTLYQGLLLAACGIFGGVLFGSLIGVTGAFRRDSSAPADKAKAAANFSGAA
jgi:hypothetical protein